MGGDAHKTRKRLNRLRIQTFAILGLLAGFVIFNGVNSLLRWDTQASQQRERDLNSRMALTEAIFYSEADKFYTTASILAAQRSRYVNYLEYDDVRSINTGLQSFASLYDIDLVLLFDENRRLVATSDVFEDPAQFDSAAYQNAIGEHFSLDPGLVEFPRSLFPLDKSFEYSPQPLLTFRIGISLYYDTGDLAAQVFMFRALNGRYALARHIRELAGAEVLLYSRHHQRVLSSVSGEAEEPWAQGMVYEGVPYFIKNSKLKGLYHDPVATLLVALDSRPLLNQRSEYIHHLLVNFVPFLMTALLPIFLFVLLKRKIFDKVYQLSDALREVSEGRLSARLPDLKLSPSVKADEITEMGMHFNAMMDKLQYSYNELGRKQQQLEEMNTELQLEVGVREQAEQELLEAKRETERLNLRLAAENLRMSSELDVSRKLQHMVLPTSAELARIQPLDIACFMQPATEVGGDYYDVLQHGDRVKIGIGDVTGHGLESGVLMLMVQMAVRTLLASNIDDPEAFLEILNRAVFENIQRMNLDKNLTLCLLDYHQGRVQLTGQHEEVIVVRHGGRLERIDTAELGFMIGLEEDITNLIGHCEIEMRPGDAVVLYTDGLTEARNPAGHLYGVERMCQVISDNWRQPAQAMLNAVVEDVQRHIAERPIDDDITLMVLRQK